MSAQTIQPSLPAAPMRTGEALINGTTVPIRGLTRAEALELRSLADHDGADRLGEIFLISRGSSVSEDEAAAWWDESDAGDVQDLVSAIATLSRLVGSDGKAPKS